MGQLDKYRNRTATPTPTPSTSALDRYRNPDPPAEDSSISPWAIGAAGVAAGVGAVALHKPQLAKKLYDTALAARYIPMLSGFAMPKSMLGNVGAALASSAERRSMTPLKEFFSARTAKDFGRELMSPTARGSGQVALSAGKFNPFGRVMGAADEATQGALTRAGLTRAQAAEQTLQTPLHASLAKPLGTPLGRLLVPFQRTPFNQYIQTFKATAEHPGVAGAAFGAGALTGAATEDWRTPGLAAPLAGRYSGPFALGAVVGRGYSGGKDAMRVASGTSPTSDDSMAGPLLNPLKSYRPSVLSMLRYLGVVD